MADAARLAEPEPAAPVETREPEVAEKGHTVRHTGGVPLGPEKE